jgi:hypothetical protein
MPCGEILFICANQMGVLRGCQTGSSGDVGRAEKNELLHRFAGNLIRFSGGYTR